jgi:hypothetical protein
MAGRAAVIIVFGAFNVPPWGSMLAEPCVVRGERGAGFTWIGLNGNTIGGLIYLQAQNCACLPTTMYISGGAMDAVGVSAHIPTALQNMAVLDAWLRSHGTEVIWVTPPYVTGNNIGGNDEIDQIHAQMESFAGSRDAGDALGNPLDANFHVGDGSHLNLAGSALYASGVDRRG